MDAAIKLVGGPMDGKTVLLPVDDLRQIIVTGCTGGKILSYGLHDRSGELVRSRHVVGVYIPSKEGEAECRHNFNVEIPTVEDYTAFKRFMEEIKVEDDLIRQPDVEAKEIDNGTTKAPSQN